MFSWLEIFLWKIFKENFLGFSWQLSVLKNILTRIFLFWRKFSKFLLVKTKLFRILLWQKNHYISRFVSRVPDHINCFFKLTFVNLIFFLSLFFLLFLFLKLIENELITFLKLSIFFKIMSFSFFLKIIIVHVSRSCKTCNGLKTIKIKYSRVSPASPFFLLRKDP